MPTTEDLAEIRDNAAHYSEGLRVAEPDDMRHVSAQTDRLHKVASELAEQVQALTERLGPVLRPEAMVAGSKLDAQEPVRSPLAGQLAAAGDRLTESVERLGDLRRSLDL